MTNDVSPSPASDDTPEVLLSAELMRRLAQLQLRARRLSRSHRRGERRSRSRGHSVEFADYRDYAHGDDLRYLDWNLYGRLDRLFIKIYEEERELPVTLILDVSESMNFGRPSKLDFARRLAAALGYVALCGYDPVRVVLMPERGVNRSAAGALRLVRGQKSAPAFFTSLASLQAGDPSDFNAALWRVAVRTRRPGSVVVLSDFLDPGGYEAGLRHLVARGFHVHAVQILSRDEMEPETFGDLKVVDAETGAETEVTFGRFRMKTYRQAVESYCCQLEQFCRKRGIGICRLLSDASLEAVLLRQFRDAMIWK